jgi:V/A-type H+/Na+-transporting ATPase subunit E
LLSPFCCGQKYKEKKKKSNQQGRIVWSMGLEKIIEKIQKESEEKIRQILQDAETQATQILQEKQKIVEQSIQKKKKELAKQIELFKTQEQSGIDIELKKIRLNAEKDLLNTTYQECLDALASLPHEKILSSLLNKIQKELPEATYIYSNKRDEATVRASSKLTYNGSINCLGGIIVENKERTMKVDYQYETIADLIWEHNLKEIATQLFR